MKRNPKLWAAPKIWQDGECFILGGGPSLGRVNLEVLKGKRCLAVNNAFKLGDWIDAMFFGDCRWYNWEGKNLLNFAGLKVTTCERHTDKPGIKVIQRHNSPFGISSNPGVLFWNLSSGACAINLAVLFGVKRIILLGFDMKPDGVKHNYHNDYPEADGKITKRQDPGARYVRFMKPFPQIAEDLKRLNVECLNATEGSALTIFPMVRLEDVV